MSKSKLPPLDEAAFDGYKEKKELDFTSRCTHKNAQIVGSELRCMCGAGWTGANIASLHNLLKHRT